MQNSQSLAYLSGLLLFEGTGGILGLVAPLALFSWFIATHRLSFPGSCVPPQLSKHSGPGSLQGSSAYQAVTLDG